MSLKAPFRSYKSTDDRDWPMCCSLLDAESTGFGPKRLRCSVLTVLNTVEAERNTEQNNKDNQGLFVATSSFMLSQSSGNTW